MKVPPPVLPYIILWPSCTNTIRTTFSESPLPLIRLPPLLFSKSLLRKLLGTHAFWSSAALPRGGENIRENIRENMLTQLGGKITLRESVLWIAVVTR